MYPLEKVDGIRMIRKGKVGQSASVSINLRYYNQWSICAQQMHNKSEDWCSLPAS